MTIVRLDIDPEQFRCDLTNRVQSSNMQSLPELITSLAVEQFKHKLRSLVNSGEIVRFKVDCIRSPLNTLWPPLSKLPLCLKHVGEQETAFDIGCFTITLITKGDSCSEINVQRPGNLQILQSVEVRRQSLRTVCKHVMRMRQVGLPAHLLIPVGNALVPSCQCPPDCLAPYIDGVWDWALSFICRVCGKSYFCECFRGAVEKHLIRALEERGHYSESGWPHKFIGRYEQSEFRPGICHLCRDIASQLFYCHPMYGSKVMVHYGPYIMRTAIEKGIDHHDAENEIRDALGIPRIGEGWVSEVELLNMVKDIFPNVEVFHQASPEWLGRQRLDVFIPELSVAIEYQGLQHYEPVTFFEGERGYRQTQERDKIKAKLCAAHGVTLVFFRYDETITRELVETRMRETLAKQRIRPNIQQCNGI